MPTASTLVIPRRAPPSARPDPGWEALTPLAFPIACKCARAFARHIEAHAEELADILLEYESFEVIQDETARTLDLLYHLDENEGYFALRIGAVTAFLPRNQPLYALACFVLVPSLMASEVHFRIPHSMRHFFPQLLRALKVQEFFPNVIVSNKERLDFLQERSALRIDPDTGSSVPVSDAVIFTGTSVHAERLRLVFDRRTLFIANGAGHNPIVVADDADVSRAVEATLALTLYNQGQDCAAPNAILVQHRVLEPFLRRLRAGLGRVKVGPYYDRSCKVGPISEPEDLVRIEGLLISNRSWLDPSTPGVIRARDAIVEPTIICRPLTAGGNYTEAFAPLIVVQPYEEGSDLAMYFEHPRYARNAMYLSLFGTSAYVEGLIDRPIAGKVLHDRASVLHETHLHAPGVERGTRPYGGLGPDASSLSIDGKIICKPTLPQRDIYEHLVLPRLASGRLDERRRILRRMTRVVPKDVSKLLGLKSQAPAEIQGGQSPGKQYVDVLHLRTAACRYLELAADRLVSLLGRPNVAWIASMEPKHGAQVRALRQLLSQRPDIRPDELEPLLYALARTPSATPQENRAAQLALFRHVYQLLLGRNSGPRLAQFLVDVDRRAALALLDV